MIMDRRHTLCGSHTCLHAPKLVITTELYCDINNKVSLLDTARGGHDKAFYKVC